MLEDRGDVGSIVHSKLGWPITVFEYFESREMATNGKPTTEQTLFHSIRIRSPSAAQRIGGRERL